MRIFKISYGGNSIQERSEQFFSTISSLKGIKENFYRSLASHEQINTSLVGNNAETKSKFIKYIKEQCHDVFYFAAATTHGSKLIDELYSNSLQK